MSIENSNSLSRLSKIWFISCFVFILAGSWSVYFFKIPLGKSVVELRERAHFPHGFILKRIISDPDYPKSFESFINDNYGFRDLFIRMKHQFDYSVFKESKQTFISDEGWLTDLSLLLVQQPRVDSLGDADFDYIKEKILKLRGKLADQGITLILLPIPLKNTVYPEKFHDAPYFRSRPIFLKLRDFLREHPELPFIDIYQLAKEQHGKNYFFYKTDMHWNALGYTYASEFLIGLLGKLSDTGIKWRHKIDFRDSPDPNFVGLESSSMGLFRAPIEDVPVFLKAGEPCGNYPVPGVPNVGLPFVGHYKTSGSCKGPLLPKTVMIGNSFMLPLYSNGFMDHFQEVYTLHDLLHFGELLGNIPKGTKFVIWEFFEMEIGFQLLQPAWWRQLDEPVRFVDGL